MKSFIFATLITLTCGVALAHVVEHTHDAPSACTATASSIPSARIDFHRLCGNIKPDCDLPRRRVVHVFVSANRSGSSGWSR